MSEIRDAIQKIAKQGNVQTFSAFVAKVVAVNNDNTCDCEPLSESVTVFDVRFRAQIQGTAGFFAKPKVGSFVVIVMLDKNNAFIALMSDVDEVYCIADGQNNGGVVKISYLLERLNDIETKLTSALTLIKTHTHAVASGVASPSPMLASMVTSIGSTVRSLLENIKFKH